MNHLPPCQEWADRLITNHADTLSPSDYLMLKEHLLTCPNCMAAHCTYLGVEAQIRSLPMLQPQRVLSASLLREAETCQRIIQPQRTSMRQWTHALRKSATLVFAMYITPLKNLTASLRKPGYALVALLFCLLTTVAGIGAIGTVNHVSHSNTFLPTTRGPHLTVNTTSLALSVTTPFSSTASTSPAVDQKALLVARGSLILQNPSKQALLWRFNSEKSFVVYNFNGVKLQTQPAYGTLQSNQHSPIQIQADGISFAWFSSSHTIKLGYIVLTSNGNDVSVPMTLESTPKSSSTPQPLSFEVKDKTTPPYLSEYTLQKQSV